MNMGTPHPSRNQGKILKSHGIERVNGTLRINAFIAMLPCNTRCTDETCSFKKSFSYLNSNWTTLKVLDLAMEEIIKTEPISLIT